MEILFLMAHDHFAKKCFLASHLFAEKPIPCATVLLVQLQISRLCRFQYCFLHFSFSKSH